jgi:hypothetical protein
MAPAAPPVPAVPLLPLDPSAEITMVPLHPGFSRYLAQPCSTGKQPSSTVMKQSLSSAMGAEQLDRASLASPDGPVTAPASAPNRHDVRSDLR